MEKTRILIIEDNEAFQEECKRWLGKSEYEIHCVGNADQALINIQRLKPHLVILDLRLPPSNEPTEGLRLLRSSLKTHPLGKVIVLTIESNKSVAIEAIRSGAEDLLIKPVDPDVLTIVVERTLKKQELEAEVEALRREKNGDGEFCGILGKAGAMQDVFKGISYVASNDETVLITGETGTGKSLVARTIHEQSGRKKHAFVEINCGGFARDLVESTLFGHEKGAFTGASKQNRGVFEEAHKGTLFLDEIGDLPHGMQVKLLHAVENKKVRRVGGSTDISVDVRIIAATNKNLVEEVKKGVFRQDLYYRLHVLPIHIPPLRERKNDITLLASHFFNVHASENRMSLKWISQEVEECLLAYPWPGNVRELDHIILRSVLNARKDQKALLLSDLPDKISGKETDGSDKKENEEEGSREEILTKMKKDEEKRLKEALIKMNGNKAKAAELLGMPITTFKRKVKRLFDI